MIKELKKLAKRFDSKACSTILDRKIPRGSGHYGEYYYMGKGLGLKVLRECYNSREGLLRSNGWELAKKEVELLRLAKKSDLTPIPFKILPVEVSNEYWSPAILMEHIQGTLLVNYNKWEEHIKDSFCTALQIVLLERTGLFHKDCAQHNVIVRKTRQGDVLFKMLDFTPDHVQWESNIVSRKTHAEELVKAYRKKCSNVAKLL